MNDPLGDEFFFSPDIGHFVLRDGQMYTQYGEVVPSSAAVRLMPVPAGSHENYADWTEEHRHEVRKAFEKEAQQQKAAEQAESARRDALVEQARGKLTAEEFEAVYDQGFENGRGY
jgi:hypothetical protein